MRFMCLVNIDPEIAATLSEQDWHDFRRDNRKFDEELIAAGRFVMASPLDRPETAVTIRLRKGSIMVTDGPFIETKEHLAGFVIFEADDREEAAEIARGSAFVRVGSVDLRALTDYETSNVPESADA